MCSPTITKPAPAPPPPDYAEAQLRELNYQATERKIRQSNTKRAFGVLSVDQAPKTVLGG